VIALYWMDARNLDPARFSAQLGKKAFERIADCGNIRIQKERLGSALLIKEVFSRFGWEEEKIFRDERGKPQIADGCFNLSHSGGMCVLVISDHAVGCDVEQIRSVPTRILTHCFTAYEREAVFASRDREAMFFKIWTAKESYLKMTGEGIGGLSRVEVDTSTSRIYDTGVLQPCRLTNIERERFCVTVCGAESCTRSEILLSHAFS